MVAHDDVILCLTYKQLSAFSSVNGEKTVGAERRGWVRIGGRSVRHRRPGLDDSNGSVRRSGPVEEIRFPGRGRPVNSGAWTCTPGEVKRRVSRNILPGVHHHRCYRNKATEDFLVYGQGGLEFMDLHGDNHSGNLWTRGICQYGVMPANGYIYVPPHPCQCFSQDMLHGFYALAASNSTADIVFESDLQKGPAFSDTSGRNASPGGARQTTGTSVAAAGNLRQTRRVADVPPRHHA